MFSKTCRNLLSYLALLFVPAGVGIVSYLARVADEWVAITVTLIASTTLTMVVTAFTLRALMKRADSSDG